MNSKTGKKLCLFVLVYLTLFHVIGYSAGGISFLKTELGLFVGVLRRSLDALMFYKLLFLNFSSRLDYPMAVYLIIGGISLLISMYWEKLSFRNRDSVNTDKIKRGPSLLKAKEFNRLVRRSLEQEAEEILNDLDSGKGNFSKSSFVNDQINNSFKASFDGDKLMLPDAFLSRHLAFAGTTGAGKSTQIKHLIEYINSKSQKSIIIDINGEIFSELGREEDIILSPFDSRSYRWDFDKESLNGKNISPSEFAKYLVPEGGAGNSFWWKGARSVLAEIIRVYENSDRILAALGGSKTNLVNSISTIAKNIIGKLGTPQEAGILGTISCDMLFLNYLNDFNKKSKSDYFSICDWANSRTCNNLFLIVSDSQFESISPLFRTWVNLAILARFESGQDNDLPPLNYIIDEFPSLGKIEPLEKGLARLRKYKGRVVLGYQGESQLSAIYGEKVTNSMIGQIGTLFMFRTQQEGDAKKMARHIGRSEVISVSVNNSDGGAKGKQGKSISRSTSYKDIVLDSEISSLPDGHFYMKCLNLNTVKSRIKKKKWSIKNPREQHIVEHKEIVEKITRTDDVITNKQVVVSNRIFRIPKREQDTAFWFN